MKKIIVIGSANTDMVVQSERLPGPGETVLGGSFLMNPGGKGANQAVAAQRLGGQVVFVAKVGDDALGQAARQGFQADGIDTEFVYQDADAPSGVALIGVDANGENAIMVAPGANANLSGAEVADALAKHRTSEWVLLQLEISLETVEASIRESTRRGMKVILNPAPAQPLGDEILQNVYLITPNETEVELLTGIAVTDRDSARRAAEVLHARGVENVIVTMGAQGAFFHNATQEMMVPASKVAVVDTTAAGDVFNGAMLVALSEQMPLPNALAFACQAAALSVSRLGAQASVPTRAEVDAALSPA